MQRKFVPEGHYILYRCNTFYPETLEMPEKKHKKGAKKKATSDRTAKVGFLFLGRLEEQKLSQMSFKSS